MAKLDNEVYNAIFGYNIGSYYAGVGLFHKEGSPARVNFNFDEIAAIDNVTKNFLGFYHTHPNFSAAPSILDIETMEAWTASFGRDLLCLIKGVNGLRGYLVDVDGNWYLLNRTYKKGRFFLGTKHKNDLYHLRSW